MKKEKLEKILEDTLEKPESFHHLCYGGSSIKMVDIYSSNKEFTCTYQGDKNWMTPVCENCTGLVSKSQSLTDYQEKLNSGMRRLHDAITRVLAKETD